MRKNKVTNINITSPLPEEKAKDEKYLASVLMGIFAALGIGRLMVKEGLEIANKYIKDRNNRFIRSFVELDTALYNKEVHFGRLASTPSLERLGSSKMSADMFLSLYFVIMKISPEQKEEFCDILEALGDKFAEERKDITFDFWLWLIHGQGFTFDFARYAHTEHGFEFRVAGDKVVGYNGVTVVCNVPVPSSLYDARNLLKLIGCPFKIE